MKCWECKKQITTARLVNYFDGLNEKRRDICHDCLPLLQRNGCGFVEVPKITQRQLNIALGKC